MYIGPWQEYKLSKQRAVGAGDPRAAPVGVSSNASTSVPPYMMKELEKILHNTLDPAAAQAALFAMNQVLKENAQLKGVSGNVSESAESFDQIRKHNDNMVDSLSLHLLDHQYQKQHESHSQRNQPTYVFSDDIYTPRGNTPCLDHLSVHSQERRVIPPVVLSARNNRSHHHYQASPLSVRSSKSEPVQSLPSLLNVTPAIAHSQYHSSNLTSKNLAINQQRLQQQSLYEDRKLAYVEKPVINSAPSKLPENSVTSGYDTGAVVNFLRRERNQRAKAEISKLTGWNILHGGVGVSADIRSSIAASDASGDSNKPLTLPPKDKATLLREKKIAEVEQRKAIYLNGAQQHDTANNYTFNNENYRLMPSANDPALSIVSRKCELNQQENCSQVIPFPKLQEIEQFSDDHMLLISKYFQDDLPSEDTKDEKSNNKETVGIIMENDILPQEEQNSASDREDYLSLPLDGEYMIPTKSMAQLQNYNDLYSSRESYETIETNSFRKQQLDDDFNLSRDVSHQPSHSSLLQPVLSQHRGNSNMEYNSELQTPREELPLMFSPPDTAMGKVLATGSFMEDVTSGNLDSLLSWTRQLDKVDLDDY